MLLFAQTFDFVASIFKTEETNTVHFDVNDKRCFKMEDGEEQPTMELPPPEEPGMEV